MFSFLPKKSASKLLQEALQIGNKWVENVDILMGRCGLLLAVFASDVIYNEDAVSQLLHTLRELTGPTTTVLISGELRNGNTI
jgi:predicted nicotinamide N-methyase